MQKSKLVHLLGNKWHVMIGWRLMHKMILTVSIKLYVNLMKIALCWWSLTQIQKRVSKVLLMKYSDMKWRKTLPNQLIHYNGGNVMNVNIRNWYFLQRVFCAYQLSQSHVSDYIYVCIYIYREILTQWKTKRDTCINKMVSVHGVAGIGIYKPFFDERCCQLSQFY